VCLSNRLFLNGKIEENNFTERINSNERGKILCEKPTVGNYSCTTHFVFYPSFCVCEKKTNDPPGSKSSKVIALQSETVGVIEEQLPDNK
jgi:hypothetical protein